ncbi:MAG: GNAT family N-acetyltransferase [Rhodobacteraceae bacterium]|nr:MAG: GNAT family N-acetyltransferase [Paracoccaceae bacterium]
MSGPQGLRADVASLAEALAEPQLAACADAWAGSDPTRSAKWIAAWHECFADPTRDPCLVVRTAAGEPAGLLPLVRRRLGPGGLVRALWTGANGQSQRAAFLCPGGAEAATAEACVDAMAAMPGWDFARLQGLSAAAADAFLDAAAKVRMTAAVEHRFEHAFVRTDGPVEAYEAARSRDTVRRKERLARALAREGAVTMRMIDAPPATVAEALEAHMAAEKTSWKASGGELLTARAEIAAFYRTLARRFGAEGAFVLAQMRIDGRLVAGIIGLRGGGGLVGLKIFHDSAFDRFSPGWLMMRHWVRFGFSDPAVRRLDFYTPPSRARHFAEGAEPHADLTLWRPGLRGAAIRLARDATRMLRGRRGAESGRAA